MDETKALHAHTGRIGVQQAPVGRSTGRSISSHEHGEHGTVNMARVESRLYRRSSLNLHIKNISDACMKHTCRLGNFNQIPGTT